jgi:hypothetical protein
MIVIIKLVLVFMMVSILIAPALEFLFYQPGKSWGSVNPKFASLLKGFQKGYRQKPSPATLLVFRALMSGLLVMAFLLERNWGFLLLGLMPILAHVRERLTPVERIQGDERDFEIRLKATATSLMIAVLIPLIFSMLWSFQVDAFTLISAIFILSEVTHIAILRFLAPMDTLETEEELVT